MVYLLVKKIDGDHMQLKLETKVSITRTQVKQF